MQRVSSSHYQQATSKPASSQQSLKNDRQNLRDSARDHSAAAPAAPPPKRQHPHRSALASHSDSGSAAQAAAGVDLAIKAAWREASSLQHLAAADSTDVMEEEVGESSAGGSGMPPSSFCSTPWVQEQALQQQPPAAGGRHRLSQSSALDTSTTFRCSNGNLSSCSMLPATSTTILAEETEEDCLDDDDDYEEGSSAGCQQQQATSHVPQAPTCDGLPVAQADQADQDQDQPQEQGQGCEEGSCCSSCSTQLALMGVIGQGSYAKVYKGRWNNKLVSARLGSVRLRVGLVLVCVGGALRMHTATATHTLHLMVSMCAQTCGCTLGFRAEVSGQRVLGAAGARSWSLGFRVEGSGRRAWGATGVSSWSVRRTSWVLLSRMPPRVTEISNCRPPPPYPLCALGGRQGDPADARPV